MLAGTFRPVANVAHRVRLRAAPRRVTLNEPPANLDSGRISDDNFMNKSELGPNVAAQAFVLSAAADTVVAAVLPTTDEAVARNEIVAIARSRAPAFKAGKNLLEAISAGK